MNKSKKQLQEELNNALAANQRLCEEREEIKRKLIESEAKLEDRTPSIREASQQLSAASVQDKAIVVAAQELFAWKWKVLPDMSKMGSDDWTKLTGQFDKLKKAVTGEKSS